MKNKQKIFEKYDFSDRRKWIAYLPIITWIEQHPEDFIHASQKEITRKTFSSQPTLSRMSKKLGFETFRDLQIYVAQVFEAQNFDKNIDVLEANSIHNVKTNVLNQYTNLAKLVHNTIDEKELETLGNAIFESEVTVIFGLGSSGESARYMRKQLRKFGIIALAMSSIHDFLDAYEALKNKNAHFLLISKSFLNREIRTIFDQLVKDKQKFSIITKNKDMQNSSCKNVISFEFFDQQNFAFDVITKIATYMILDITLFYVVNKKDPNFKMIKNSTSLIKEWNKNK